MRVLYLTLMMILTKMRRFRTRLNMMINKPKIKSRKRMNSKSNKVQNSKSNNNLKKSKNSLNNPNNKSKIRK